MSRNAAALKSSISKRPQRSLRFVKLSEDATHEAPQFAAKVQGLKNIALTLLKEAQALESETLMSELAMPHGISQKDIENGIKLNSAVRQFESNIIRQALLITSGNQAQAARLLGIKPNTLNYKIKLYNL